MSDNVSRLAPRPGRRVWKRIVAFALVFLLAAAAAGLYAFRDRLNLDAARRFVRYLNVRADASGGGFTFDSHNANQYASMQGGLAVAAVSGLSVYDAEGEETGFAQAKLETPALRMGEKLALAFDVGGTRLLALSDSGEVRLDITTPRPIFDADAAEDGALCYAAAESGYKTVLYAYDAQQTLIYRWLSSSQYLPLCAVSPGAGYLAAISPGQQSGMFASELHIFNTASNDAPRTASLGTELVYDLDFADDALLCVVGETKAQWVGLDGIVQASYSYDGEYLSDFDFGGDGFLSLIVNMYKAGNHCRVVSVDETGTELGSMAFDEQILDFSAAGGYLAVLTAEKLTIYDSTMKPYFERTNTKSATNVIMRADGSAILLGGGRGETVLP